MKLSSQQPPPTLVGQAAAVLSSYPHLASRTLQRPRRHRICDSYTPCSAGFKPVPHHPTCLPPEAHCHSLSLIGPACWEARGEVRCGGVVWMTSILAMFCEPCASSPRQ